MSFLALFLSSVLALILVPFLVLIILFLIDRPGEFSMPSYSPKIAVEDDSLPELPCLPATQERYAVIGAGFLGRELVKALRARGEKHIVAMNLTGRPAWLEEEVEHRQLDLRNGAEVERVIGEVKPTVVFLVAALMAYHERLPHQYSRSYLSNVQATRNVLIACRRHSVPYLIYTSTPQVVLGHDQPLGRLSESTPYATRHFSHYGSTKALAERAILAANGSTWTSDRPGALRTAAVRPCSSIFGAHDRGVFDFHWGPGMEPQSRPSGPLIFETTVDYVYIENVAHAHMLCEQALREGVEGVAGETFCISNNEPLKSIEFAARFDYYVPGKGRAWQRMPLWLLWTLAIGSETYQRIMKKGGLGDLDNMTPSLLYSAGTYNVFDCKKAERVLGYRPVFTIDQGIRKSCEAQMKA